MNVVPDGLARRRLDAAAMLDDNPPDDRQPEPAAPPFRRVVGHEELLAVGGRHAGPVVADDEPDDAVPRVAGRRHDDRRLLARRAGAQAIERLHRVVDEVDDDLANLLGVEAHGRQVGFETALEPHASALEHAPYRFSVSSTSRLRLVGTIRGPRKPRELRELVDQPLEGLDLGDDRVGALADERGRAAAARC